MVAREERAVKTIYLQNFEKYQEVLAYHANGDYHIRSQIDVTEEKTKGTYVSKENTIIGIYASIDGPVVFLNHEKYYLKTDNLQFDIEERSDSRRKFKLTKSGVPIYEYTYPRTEFVDYDPWSSEDDVDFFSWLVKISQKDHFVMNYTLGLRK